MSNDNQKRGLAAADQETRERVAKEGGEARAEKTNMSELGRKGGESTAEKYGDEFYQEIGRMGGQARGNQQSGDDQEESSSDDDESQGRPFEDREFASEQGRKGGSK